MYSIPCCRSNLVLIAFTIFLNWGTPRSKDLWQIFGEDPSWGIGYGIGTSVGRKRWTWQLEAMAMQISEQERWSEELNLLTQLRWTIDWRIGKHLSLFAGPTINIFITQKFDTDTQQFNSMLLQEDTFLDETVPGENAHKVQAGSIIK